MAQTKVDLTQPTTYYQPTGQKITLQPGSHFIGEGWSTAPPTANQPTPPPATEETPFRYETPADPYADVLS